MIEVIPVIVLRGIGRIAARSNRGPAHISVNERRIPARRRPQGPPDAFLAHYGGELNNGESLFGAGPQVELDFVARRHLGQELAERYSYPVQLAALLGSGYEVRHFGVGGTTLLAEGDKPYRRQPQWQAALDFDPDVVLLLLGANDTCGAPRNNWDRSAAFVSDARSLLQSLRRPGRRVIVALPSPLYPATPGLKPERKEDLEARSPRLELIRGWWREAARAETAEVVDLAGTLAPDSRLTGDGVHPTNAGYGQIAARFRDAILGQPAAGHSRNAAATRVPRTALKVPESALAKALVWQGVAIAETNYTIWGASPVVADGRYHLFAARWPEASVDPAWRKSSEIARYVSDQPEGPFRF